MIKRLTLAFIFCFAITTVMGQIRLPVHVRADTGGAPDPGEALTFSDFTYLGALRVGTVIWDTNHGPAGMALRRVGGSTHLLIGQGGVGEFYWPNAPTEFIDGGGYSKTMASTPIMSVYNHWGYTDGAKYDMYHGLFGKTYDSSGTVVGLGGTDNEYRNFVWGIFWTDESATCCLITTYGLPYGNYDNGASMLVTEFTTLGTGNPTYTGMTTTTHGPIRTCQGVQSYGGSAEICGGMRAESFTRLPDGSFGVTQGSSATQQGATMKGPNLFGGLSAPNMSTIVGYGSSRAGTTSGGIEPRTTDLVFPTKYLASYNLGTTVGAAGTHPGPFVTARRPAHTPVSGRPFTQYTFEGVDCADPATGYSIDYIDPTTNGGVGTWTEGDGMGGGIYIPGSKNGFLNIANLSVGHGWYKTRACLDYYRNAAEAVLNFDDAVVNNNNLNFYGNSNYSTLKRIRFVNDGASQSFSISIVGNDITVHLATNGSSVVTTTAAAMRTALLADSSVMALLSAIDHGVEGPSNALYTSDGSSTVPTRGFMKLAGGPQNCPRHNIDMGYAVTGPGTTEIRSAFLLYDMVDLSATPDYSPEPTWSWFGDDPEVLMTRDGLQSNEPCGSMNFDPVSRKLYVLCGTETTTDGAARHFVNVWQVAGTASPAADEAVAARMAHNAEIAHLNDAIQAGVHYTEQGLLLMFTLSMVAVSARRRR